MVVRIFGRSPSVSIPFKREGISKESRYERSFSDTVTVSIPFKREGISKANGNGNKTEITPRKFQFPSNGKAYPKARVFNVPDDFWNLSFNSLQTGRHIQSRCPRITRKDQRVSIPFKREGISKDRKKRNEQM